MKNSRRFVVYSAFVGALVLLVVKLVSVTGLAQQTLDPNRYQALDPSKFTELIRSDLSSRKVQLMTDALSLNSQESNAFWPIYREYDVELQKVNDERLSLAKEFGSSYANMTDDLAKSILDRWFKIQENRMSLLKKYGHRVEKDVSSIRAAQFVHVEHFVNSLVDAKISGNLPFIQKLH